MVPIILFGDFDKEDAINNEIAIQKKKKSERKILHEDSDSLKEEE